MKRNVLITGAAGNLGTAAVRTFLDAGYKVMGIIHAGSESKLLVKHPDLDIKELDVSQESATEEFFQKLSTTHNTIDAALLLVGGFKPGKLQATSVNNLNDMFRLNFFTAFSITRPLILKMLTQETGGRIVFVGSRPGLYAAEAKNSIAYGLSKSLLFRFSEIINANYNKDGIFSSVLVPTTIDTPQNRVSMPKADFSTWDQAEDLAKKMEAFASGKLKSLYEINM